MLADVPVQEWTVGDVVEWLHAIGFGKYEATFSEQLIDGLALLTISESDLRKPPLEIRVLGDIKNLMICIRELQWQNVDALTDLLCSDSELLPASTAAQAIGRRNSMHNRRASWDGPEPSPDMSFESDDEDDDGYSVGAAASSLLSRFKPEMRKMMLGVLYFLSVAWIIAIVTAVVHDRVPDMEAYPPLPDILLDNLPDISCPFAVCKFTGLVLFVVWVSILILRRHRFILLRCIAMLTA